MKNYYQALVVKNGKQYDITLADDTFTDAANKLTVLGFTVRALVWLEPASNGEANRILNQSSADHATAVIMNKSVKE